MESKQPTQYEVSAGGSLAIPGSTAIGQSRLLLPGTLLPLDAFEPAEVERLAREGKIKPRGTVAQNTPASSGKKPNRSPGKWRFDPRTLISLDLERLNVMISETDPKQSLADTEEGAIQILSADFDEEFDAVPPAGGISPVIVQMAQVGKPELDR